MTFKHTKFEDSATMRSLVKVAAEKGWVKSEPLEKTASVKEDLSPTANLTQNVIKLVAGLRKSGMNKFADELEGKFVAYKQATTMYDVHGEKGEDLVDAAHPKGGHKMENLEGDAFIETIIERHLKMLDMVDKKPTGKLASHREILNAVKIVLAEVDAEAQGKGKTAMLNALTKITEGLTAFGGVFVDSAKTAYQPVLDSYIAQIKKLSDELNGVDTNTVEVSNDLVNRIGGTIYKAKQWVSGIRKYHSSKQLEGKDNPGYVEDKGWWSKFNAAASKVDTGQSLSWGAAKAFEGDLSGLAWHSSHVSSAEASSIVTINLVRPMQAARAKVEEMDYWNAKWKLPEDQRNKADAVITELDKAITVAQSAASSIASQGSGDELRVIHVDKINSFFTAPLDDTFKVKDLAGLKTQCGQVAGLYTKNMGIIKGWIDKAAAAPAAK